MPMWANQLRYISGDGTAVEALSQVSRDASIGPLINAYLRWRYIDKIGNEGVKATSHLRHFLTVWDRLDDEVESRWRKRFGDEQVSALIDDLRRIAGPRAGQMPPCLPVVSSRSALPFATQLSESGDAPPPAGIAPLPPALSRALLALTLAVEAESTVAMPLGANVLRVLSVDAPIAMVHLPTVTGIPKEGGAQSMTVLSRQAWAIREPLTRTASNASRRSLQVRLTAKGQAAQEVWAARVQHVENDWDQRFNRDTSRDFLSRIVGKELASAPVMQGLHAPDCGWRAMRRTPLCLPEHPLVLGRGAWPDAS